MHTQPNHTLPPEVVRTAEILAEQSERPAGEILSEWTQTGMLRSLVRALLTEDQIENEETGLDQEERQTLAALFRRHQAEELDEAEAEQLDNLLHAYRRSLVGETQAVMDWLALSGLPQGSPVSHLVTLRSTMLYAAGYDPEKQVLDVVFNSGGVYRYFDVPPHIYKGLLDAPSVGRFMWDHVLGAYPYVRLDRRSRTRRRTPSPRQRRVHRAPSPLAQAA